MGNTLGCEGPEIFEEAPVPKDPDRLSAYAGNGPWYTCRPDGGNPVRFAKKGIASSGGCATETFPSMLKRAAESKGDKPAMKVERPLPPQDKDGTVPPALPDEEWTTWTFKDYYRDARRAARAFLKLGLQPYDSVSVWGFNAPEWAFTMAGATMVGAKMAGLYPTDTPDTAAFKVAHSGAAVVVYEDKNKLERLVKALNARSDPKLPRVKAFVAYGYTPADGETVAIKGYAKPVLSWAALMQMGQVAGDDETICDESSADGGMCGAEAETSESESSVRPSHAGEADAQLDARIAAVKPEQCAALVYTSGTTGEPKAVMISHDSLIFETSSVFLSTVGKIHDIGVNPIQERILSYLPMSHVAGLMVDVCVPTVLTGKSPSWCTVYFARPYDLKAGSVKDRLCACRPTCFLGVPLVWEKIADKLRAIGAANSGLKQSIATWAKDLGLKYSKNCLMGGDGSKPFGHTLADKVVLKNVKAALGMDQLKYGATGAAPIRVDTLEYFGSLGIDILELYGMSECTGASTVSSHAAHIWGCCGHPINGVEVKVFKVDPDDINKKQECPRSPGLDNLDDVFQGEVCFRGRNIMMGYLAQPDFGDAHVKSIEKKTMEAIDREGWMHSGDKGMMTESGMLKITGRFKELIIGDGGENIAPVPIEDHIKAACDGINEVMMIGDKRKFNVAIITLKAVGANGEVPGTDELDAGAKRVNPAVKTISAALDDKTWIETVTKAVTSANSDGKICPNNAFKVQKFMILPTNFSEEQGHLTPTKKLKRPVVEKAFSKQVEQMYASKETYVRYQA